MRILVRLFAVIGVLTVLLFALAAVGVWQLASGHGGKSLPQTIVLELDLQEPLAEATPADPLADFLFARRPTVRGVVETLDRAAADPRVKGLVARFGNQVQGFGTTQELRAAIARFRAAGKFTIAHAESFGEFQPGEQAYYLAAAFEQVWMQPMGNLNITGLQSEMPFARGTLEKLSITPQVTKRYEYKSASELLGERNATGPNREMTESLIGDLFEQMVTGIAADRRLPAEAVRALVDKAPLLDKEAVDAKLLDRLGYLDEAEDTALEKAGGDTAGKGTAGRADLVELSDYAGLAPARPAGPKVALIVGDGGISRGSGDGGLGGGDGMRSDDIADAFEDATEDAAVKAILFRVNSPGGSAVASETIRRAVIRAKSAGKKVIVSMADVAGSGGYWVAMDADRIVAQPGTFTGSIGVLAVKLVTQEAWEKIGINWTTIARGQNASLYSALTPYSPSEAARVDAMLNDIYDGFTANVAVGRSLPVERVREIAKGRVWTGRQAKEIGLVDALGGYDVALDEVRTAIGAAPGSPLSLVQFPEPRGQFGSLMELLSGNVAARAGQAMAQTAVRSALGEVKPLLTALEPLAPAAVMGERVLRMPAVGVGGY